MQSSGLATKIRIPPQTRQTLHRARLIDALERGILDYKLVLISAPAGYGKTTLLAQWAHASRFPVAWLSIGEEDNDLERFFRYLLAAWERFSRASEKARWACSSVGWRRIAKPSCRLSSTSPTTHPTTLCLSSTTYHLIEEPAIHQALTFLLDHLPPTLHFVLAGRAEPPLPLARYRARHELLELRAEDLQF